MMRWQRDAGIAGEQVTMMTQPLCRQSRLSEIQNELCLGGTRPVVGEDAPIEHEVAALEALHVVGPLEEVALHAGAIHAACGREVCSE